MKQFFVENWRLILEVILVITSAVVFILRKKPVKVIDTLKEMVVRLLPYCIQQAENTELKGDGKKVFALNLLVELLKDSGFDVSGDLYKFAGEQLEVILSTPQKKGVTYVKR